jgi:predicted nucleotidyltransferase
MVRPKFKDIEKKLLQEAKKFYEDRLVSLVIYGSFGRETQRLDSDIDFLLVAKNLPNGRMKRIREFEKVEEIITFFLKSLEQEGINTYLSPVIKSPEEVSQGSPLFFDMVEDSRILFDRGKFFAKALERIKGRLGELGSRRIWKGNAWYWDLKPDLKPGEVIDL